MLKFNWQIFSAGMIAYIIIILLLFLFACLQGCSLLPTSGSSITTVPTAAQQLFKAAKNSNWLVTISILGVAAGAFAFLNGSKIGLPCIGASCISLFMALAVARFSTWMAVFGLIGSLASVGISVLVKNRAVKEMIVSTQTIKDYAVNQAGLNRSGLNRLLIENQPTKSTQKLVQNVKSKLKLRGKL